MRIGRKQLDFLILHVDGPIPVDWSEDGYVGDVLLSCWEKGFIVDAGFGPLGSQTALTQWGRIVLAENLAIEADVLWAMACLE